MISLVIGIGFYGVRFVRGPMSIRRNGFCGVQRAILTQSLSLLDTIVEQPILLAEPQDPTKSLPRLCHAGARLWVCLASVFSLLAPHFAKKWMNAHLNSCRVKILHSVEILGSGSSVISRVFLPNSLFNDEII